MGWNMSLQAVRNLVTGIAVCVGRAMRPEDDRTVIVGFFFGLAELTYQITGNHRVVNDPIGRGFRVMMVRA